MVTTHYVSRVSLQREKVESFDRYPFSLAAVRALDHLAIQCADVLLLDACAILGMEEVEGEPVG